MAPVSQNNLALLAKVATESPFRRGLFKLAYDYKMIHVEAGDDTPLLNRFIFSKTKDLLGGNIRILLSGGAPLDKTTQRFLNICMCTNVTVGYEKYILYIYTG